MENQTHRHSKSAVAFLAFKHGPRECL